MLQFEVFNDNLENELLAFLSQDGFMEFSSSPRESIIASVLEFQKKTNNYGLPKAIIVTQDSKIIGFLGILALPMIFQNKRYTIAQTNSAYISKTHRGIFSQMLDFYIKINKDTPIVSIFPIPKIFSHFENYGFTEINQQRFSKHFFIICDYKAFFKERFSFQLAPSLGKLANIFFHTYRNKNTYIFEVRKEKMFAHDYSNIENDYYLRYKNTCVSEWNASILELKYGNKLQKNISTLQENEVIHLCAYNSIKQIVGSIILKKMRGLNRLIICEIHTTIKHQEKIIISCMHAALHELNILQYHSLYFFGLTEYITNTIKKHFFTISKKYTSKVYYKANNSLPSSSIDIFFSDDDMNF